MAYKRLPAGYQEVEYLESSGTQYIDTGLKLASTDIIDCKFKALQDSGAVYGVYGNGDGAVYANSTYYTYIPLTTTRIDTGIAVDTNWHNIIHNFTTGKFNFDGTDYDITQTTFTDTINNGLFTRHNGTSYGYNLTGCISEYKLNRSGSVIQNLIPARNSNNVLGMYDLAWDNTKCGVVDLGTLNWSKREYSDSYYFFTTLTNAPDTAPSVVAKMYSTLPYDVVSFTERKDKCIFQTTNFFQPANSLYIRDDSLAGLTVQEFKTAMSGKILYYQRTIDTTFQPPFYTNAGTGTFTAGADVYYPLDSFSTKIKNPVYVVPDGYTQLEYIEVLTAGPYIDTGVKAQHEAFKVEIDGTLASAQGMLGAQISPGNTSTHLIYNNNFYIGNIGGVSNDIFSSTVRGTVILESDANKNYSITKYNGDVDTGTYTGTIISNKNYYLYATNAASVNAASTGKLYSAKLYDNGTLVFHGIPAKRNSDNVIGMYDLISNTFKTNAGTRTFTAGPEISNPKYVTSYKSYVVRPNLPTGYQELDYIQSSGTQYIDTGYYPDKTTSIDFTAMQLKSGAYDLFGTSDSNYAGKSFTIGGYSGGCINYGTSNTVTGYTLELNVKHKYTLNSVGAYIDDTLIKDTSGYTFSDGRITRSLTLMATNWSSGITEYGRSKCYGVKISESGTVIQNLVPAKRLSDNALGMYDKANSGKNLFDKTDIVDGYGIVKSTGVLQSDSACKCSNYIEVSSNTIYTISGATLSWSGYYGGAFYDEDKNFISGFGAGNVTITIPNNAKYIRYTLHDTYQPKDSSQVELGSSATAYEPYPFYTNAGTGTFTAGNNVYYLKPNYKNTIYY